MAIGLNYSHLSIGDGRILPNYLYLLPQKYRPGADVDPVELQTAITKGDLQDALADDENLSRFDHPVIKKILTKAYPYEVKMKFLGEQVANQPNRNKQLIDLFNRFFAFDYEQTLTDYCRSCDRKELFKKSQRVHNKYHYDNLAAAVEQFLGYVEQLLIDQSYSQEAKKLAAFADSHLTVTYTEGISGTTTEIGDDVMIEVGNTTYATLHHELAHFINRFFRYHYYENDQVCFDNYTKTNEGFANFVAYHLFAYISSGELQELDGMPLDERFFSAYIDVYATLKEEGTNKKKTNYAIVYQEMKKFEGEIFSDEKADFYFERFFKFFHYNQSDYFYPKEMMYYLGYQQIRDMFAASHDKAQLLAQCFLGKVCI